MVDDYMLHKALGKIKETIHIKKFDGTKILVETGDKLADDIALKNVVTLKVLKVGDKFHPQLFSEEALVA